MALNFPASPTLDEVYTAAGKSWQWNGTRWTGVSTTTGGGGGEPGSDEWVRPEEWLALPEVEATEQKMVGLFPVWPNDSNFLALRAEGSFTVDWGDGVVENFSSGAKAEHQFNYNSIPSNTLTSLGYRQVVVTITPQESNNLAVLKLNVQPAGFIGNGTRIRDMPWLDIKLSGPSLNQVVVEEAGTGSERAALRSLEQFTLLSHAITDMSYFFFGCPRLQSVNLLGTEIVTNMYGMFYGCYSLKSLQLFDTSAAIDMGQMFAYCSSLRVVPLFDTSSVFSTYNMFERCTSLESVPLFDTTSVEEMQSMFSWCQNLKSIPLFDTSNTTDVSYMFANCESIESVPLLNTSNAIYMSQMFAGCLRLKNIPALDCQSGTNLSSIVALSPSVRTAPLQNVNENISFSDCTLSRQALIDIFDGLTDRTSLASKSIEITGNFGASQLLPAERDIALNKNWTITG